LNDGDVVVVVVVDDDDDDTKMHVSIVG